MRARREDVSDSLVPALDLTGHRQGLASATKQLAQQIDWACREIGFLNIAGHGVSEALIREMYDVSLAFFDLPLEEKLQSSGDPARNTRGYHPIGGQTLSYSLDRESPPDLFEALSVADISSPVSQRGIRNVWPTRPAELRQVWTSYWYEMERLAQDISHLLALALDLDETFFDKWTRDHNSTLRANHYPSQPQHPAAGQLRAGAHSDYGDFSLLYRDAQPGGLQVQTRSGEWQDVAVIPNTFVVNLGDLLARWTNDRWISTMHRVVNPPRDRASDSRRLSIIFFHQPALDAVIECIPSCQDATNPAKYAPITSGEFVRSKLLKTIDQGRATAAS